MSASNPSAFLVKMSGQVESADFIEGDELYFTYLYYYGQDWKVIKGIEEGLSQTTRRSEDERSLFVWNFPLDVTFQATNPFGWPQIVLSLYGSDFFGNDVVRGYAVCHLPISPGRYTKKLTTFVPDSASTLQKLVSLLSGRRPEFIHPESIAQGRGREVIRVQSQGVVSISFDVIFKDFAKLGYNAGQSSTPLMNVAGSLSENSSGREKEKAGTVSVAREDYLQPSTSSGFRKLE